MKLARVARGIPEHEDHGFPVRQTTKRNFEDFVSNTAGFIEKVKACRVRGVLADEGFRVLFLGRLSGDAPRVEALFERDGIGANLEPMAGNAHLRPLLNGRPCLGFELRERVRGHGALTVRAGAHDPIHKPSDQGTFADTVAARDRHANRVNGVEPIERVFFDLLSKVA